MVYSGDDRENRGSGGLSIFVGFRESVCRKDAHHCEVLLNLRGH